MTALFLVTLAGLFSLWWYVQTIQIVSENELAELKKRMNVLECRVRVRPSAGKDVEIS